MRIFLMIAALAMFANASSTVKAEEPDYIEFHRKTIDKYWTMVGRMPTDEAEPLCFASSTGDDGTAIHITKPLWKGEWYIWIHNPDWALSEERDPPVRINFYRGKNWKFVSGGIYGWIKNTKNIARIKLPNDDWRSFLKGSQNADRMRIVMPENYANMSVFIAPVMVLLDAYIKCTDDWDRKAERLLLERKDAQKPAPAPNKTPGTGDRYDGADPPKSKGEKI